MCVTSAASWIPSIDASSAVACLGLGLLNGVAGRDADRGHAIHDTRSGARPSLGEDEHDPYASVEAEVPDSLFAGLWREALEAVAEAGRFS